MTNYSDRSYSLRFGPNYDSAYAKLKSGKLFYTNAKGIVYSDKVMLGGCHTDACGTCDEGQFVTAKSNNILFD